MKPSRRRTVVGTLVFLFIVGEWALDLHTPLGIPDWAGYVIPLLLSVYLEARFWPFLLAAGLSLLMLAGFYLSPPGGDSHQAFVSRMTGIGVLWLMAFIIWQRKRAEAELNRARDLWRMLLDNSPDHIYFKDTQSRFIKASKAQARQFGLKSPDGMAGKTDFDFFDEAHARPAFEDEQEIIRTGRPILAKEEREVWKDGHVTWASSTKMPMRDTAGKIIGIMGITRDITERKRAGESLRASEEKFSRMFHSSPVPLALSTIGEGRFLDVNAEFLKMYEWSREEVIGHTALELNIWVNPEDRAAIVSKIKGHEPVRNCEFDVRIKSGQIRRILWSEETVVIGDESCFLGTSLDITEIKLAEKQLKEAFSFNRKIIAGAPVGIIAYKASGQCVLANETAARALNATVPKLLAQDFRQIVSWRASGLLKVAEESLAAKEPRHCEASCPSSFGRQVSLVCHFSPFDQDGEPHLLLIFGDVTEKKKLEAQFLRAQRMESIGTLAGGIAHDLNNILAPLLISILLLKDKVTDAEGRNILAMLETNVHRGTDLVKQVLAFGRGMQIERVLVQLKHVAGDIRDIIRETFPQSVRFQMEIPSDLWKITGDATQIHQVLLNLCINARDAMPGGGDLSLVMENKALDEAAAATNLEARPGRYVVISVTDTGEGMSPEVQERMFEPFFTTKEHGKGTGLGLSTTLAIVKSHGGFIHCYSEPGKGSTFKVYLPVGAASAIETEPEGKLQPPRGHNELVLVVDDEKPIRRMAGQILERFGYRVLPAANGAEAVALYKQHVGEIAAVITDIAMPVMDGQAAIDAMRTINPGVKIIASSGLDSRVKARAGIRHFIPKPYTAETLVNTLNDVLRENPAR